jgi:ADP-ribosyl-[dinitrogen reductase] hydrolase
MDGTTFPVIGGGPPAFTLDGDRGDAAGIAVRERAIGCLVGAAVGDALGAPFEFLPAGTYRRRFPLPELGGIGEMIGGGSFGWAPGEFTDDTQMALVLAGSLLTQGGYDPDDVWRGWRAWAAGSSDVGNATRHALSQPDWRAVRHRDVDSTAGNGALMRAFPLALATLTVEDELARAVVLHQALTTHHHPAAAWGAWLAVAGMRAAILTGGGVAAVLAAIDAELAVMAALAPEEVERFRTMLAPGWTPPEATVGNGSVWGCLAQAVWALRTTATFADAVVAVVDLGSDADTVACVTGALAGAALGVQAIPSRWSTYVHGRVDTDEGEHRYALADLQLLALELVGAGAPGFQPRDAAVGPHPIEGRLHAANLAGAAATSEAWAVVSLCRGEGLFGGHPVRREVYLVDRPGGHNTGLADAVRDAVDTIDALLAEGRDVVVHCQGGRSRTGLVLRAWRMRHAQVDAHEAASWVAQRWPLFDDYESSFTTFLTDTWHAEVAGGGGMAERP